MTSGPDEHAQDSGHQPDSPEGPSPGASSAGDAEADARSFEYSALEKKGGVEITDGLSLLSDVELDVTVELGRTEMVVEDVLQLGEGSVVELDKLAGDPVDIYVNDRLIARGEVLVLNENFCVRVSEILNPMTVELDDSSARPASAASGSAGQEAA